MVAFRLLPGDVPLPLHEQVDVLDPAVVGVVEPLGQVLLQVRLEVLSRHFALKGKQEVSGGAAPQTDAASPLTVRLETTTWGSSGKVRHGI